jgi:hypothetical protein
MKLASTESGRGKKATRFCGTGVAALLGAATMFVVLIGIAAVADSPRSLSDPAQLPASAESFEVSPAGVPDADANTYTFSHASGQYEDTGPLVSYEVEVSV